jgi:phospholipid-translocating ATPase
LFCKGADLAIFERLSPSIEQIFLDATKEDLIKFSTKGYRTLCFATRVLDEDYYREWSTKYESLKFSSMRQNVKLHGDTSDDTIMPNLNDVDRL